MDNVKFNLGDVSTVDDVPGEREIHRRSGFRISHFQSRMSWPASEDIRPRRFRFYSLCHLIEGRGWFWTPGGGRQTVEPGQGIMVSPGFVHHYGGFMEPFVEDYIGFSGPVVDHMHRSGVIRDGIVEIGDIRRLLPIQKLALNLSDRGQLAAQSALQNLLFDLFFLNEREIGPADPLDRLLERLAHVGGEWWTVADMAAYCNLSENQFRRRFRAKTGMGPKRYYDTIKMSLASGLVLRRNMTLEKIARELGYRDSYHLSKVFKRIHGTSPEDYRRAYGK